MSNPCHIEMILIEGQEVVAKADESLTPRLNNVQRAQQKLKARRTIEAAK